MTIILAIESSCDETAAAVVTDGRIINSNIIASQIDLHAQYGGVFPEVASRAHAEVIGAVVSQAMRDAGLRYSQLDAIAVTQGPGPGGFSAGGDPLCQRAGACDRQASAWHQSSGRACLFPLALAVLRGSDFPHHYADCLWGTQRTGADDRSWPVSAAGRHHRRCGRRGI